jgi:type III secretion protein S
MGQDIFLTVMKDALMTVLLLSAPALLVAIVVGFGVGLVQALTQIQDQTLPQLVAVMLVLLVLGPLLGMKVVDLAGQMLDNFPAWTR